MKREPDILKKGRVNSILLAPFNTPRRKDFQAEAWGINNWMEYIFRGNNGEKIEIYKTDIGFVEAVGEYGYKICRPSFTVYGQRHLCKIPKTVYDFVLENCVEAKDILERRRGGNRAYLCTMGEAPDVLTGKGGRE